MVLTALNRDKINTISNIDFKIQIRQNPLEQAEHVKHEVIESHSLIEIMDGLVSGFVSRGILICKIFKISFKLFTMNFLI